MSSYLKVILNAERRATAEQLAGLTRDFDAIVDAATDVATDDEHDPEGATIAFERAQVEALRVRAREHLADLDRALALVDAGGYGVCERCRRPISPERLAARPAARHCMRCALRG